MQSYYYKKRPYASPPPPTHTHTHTQKKCKSVIFTWCG